MTLQRTSRATLDVPSHEIDLGRWIYELSDADYQACERGHRAAGSFSDEHGRGTITVEPIGGHMIISSAERWAPCLRGWTCTLRS